MLQADRASPKQASGRHVLGRLTAFAAFALLSTAGAAQAAGAPPADATPQAPIHYAESFGFQTTATAPIGPLSDADARTYAAAFDAIKKGQFSLADAIAGSVQDACLQGRLQYTKLMSTAYKATYGELKTWLDNYRDQPGADRIFTLAKKKQLGDGATGVSASAPAAVATDDPQDVAAVSALQAPVSSVDPNLQKSREAFYAGDVNTAYALATQSGERWIAGMAAFRQGKFEEAFRWLSDLAQDDVQNEWVRSAAAWWAARSAATAGLTEQAAPYLKLAAAAPYTFYGLIAAHQLGLDTPTTLAPTPDGPPIGFTRAADTRVQVTAAMMELVQNDPRARRAAALAQAGMKTDAGFELRTAVMATADPEQKKAWRGLAAALQAPLSSPDDLRRSIYKRFDPAAYAAPELSPRGGFTIEKALVYAIVRQESGFNPAATSAVGAYGLMQLMPGTASLLRGDARHPVTAAMLKDSSENLKLGQAYVAKILDSVNGDLIRAVASYNSGPGTILKTAARIGDDADSLLLIENMPGGQTREYVQRVMSNYWIYRKLWGLPSPSLDAVSAGQSHVPALLDANNGKGARVAVASAN